MICFRKCIFAVLYLRSYLFVIVKQYMNIIFVCNEELKGDMQGFSLCLLGNQLKFKLQPFGCKRARRIGVFHRNLNVSIVERKLLAIYHIYWRALKRYTRIAALMYVSKKNAKQSIWLYIKECAFMSNTWKFCPLQINLKHLKCKFFEIGVNSFIWHILSVEDPLFL